MTAHEEGGEQVEHEPKGAYLWLTSLLTQREAIFDETTSSIRRLRSERLTGLILRSEGQSFEHQRRAIADQDLELAEAIQKERERERTERKSERGALLAAQHTMLARPAVVALTGSSEFAPHLFQTLSGIKPHKKRPINYRDFFNSAKADLMRGPYLIYYAGTAKKFVQIPKTATHDKSRCDPAEIASSASFSLLPEAFGIVYPDNSVEYAYKCPPDTKMRVVNLPVANLILAPAPEGYSTIT